MNPGTSASAVKLSQWLDDKIVDNALYKEDDSDSDYSDEEEEGEQRMEK